MGVAKQYAQSPEVLKDVYVPATGTASVFAGTTAACHRVQHCRGGEPDDDHGDQHHGVARSIDRLGHRLGRDAHGAAVGHRQVCRECDATSINHQDGELATTISYNLAPGTSISQSQTAIAQAEADIHMPITVRGSSAGTATGLQPGRWPMSSRC